MSNYKIAFLQKIRRFHGRFKCSSLFSTEYVIFMQKMQKIKGFLGKLKCQSLFFDKIRHIYVKTKTKKNDADLQNNYKP